jgi:hypothetical protein
MLSAASVWSEAAGILLKRLQKPLFFRLDPEFV